MGVDGPPNHGHPAGAMLERALCARAAVNPTFCANGYYVVPFVNWSSSSRGPFENRGRLGEFTQTLVNSYRFNSIQFN